MELSEMFAAGQPPETQEDESSPMPERSSSPDALMNLVLRFETASGPRTIIACSVPRHAAAEIRHVMKAAGHDAEFVDRFSPLSVADRVMMQKLH